MSFAETQVVARAECQAVVKRALVPPPRHGEETGGDDDDKYCNYCYNFLS